MNHDLLENAQITDFSLILHTSCAGTVVVHIGEVSS